MIHFLGMVLAMIAPLLFGAVGLLLAVDPTSRRPGVGLAINLRSGTSSASGGAIRILLVSVKNATGGSGTVETLYPSVANAAAVGALAGYGGLAHLAAARLFEEHPTARVDFIMMAAASGNTAAGTITFDDTSPITSAQTVTARIAGKSVSIVWDVDETDVQAATKLVAQIAKQSKELPVTAANGGGTLAAVTLTFKSKGKAGLDCTYSVTMADGAGGNVTPAGTNLTGGTTEPDIANVIAAVVNREYRIWCPTLSNADMATASTTSNLGKIRAHIRATDTGIGALLQSAHTACTDSTTNAKACTAQHDFEYFSHHLVRGALSLPCEWTGAICGAYARDIANDPNHPFIKQELALAELYDSATPQTDSLLAAEAEDLLASGVSYIGRTAQDVPRFERPISTYFEDADGNPDDRVLDVSKVFGLMAVGDDLRTQCEQRFKGKKLAKTLPKGNTPIPPNVIEESDAKAFIVSRLRSQWVSAGVIRGDSLDAVIADGSLVVQIDSTDETQLDVFLPLRVVPPHVKTSVYLVQA